jgi:hypothetical protein
MKSWMDRVSKKVLRKIKLEWSHLDDNDIQEVLDADSEMRAADHQHKLDFEQKVSEMRAVEHFLACSSQNPLWARDMLSLKIAVELVKADFSPEIAAEEAWERADAWLRARTSCPEYVG